MVIKVTQEHINLGSPGMADECPIALAITEKFPDKYVYVGDSTLEIEDDRNSYVINGEKLEIKVYENAETKLPDVAQAFISDFDSDKEVHPFSFEI